MNLAWIFFHIILFQNRDLSEKLEGVEINHGSWNRHER